MKVITTLILAFVCLGVHAQNVENKLEELMRSHGVPGLSLAIVDGDSVRYISLGQADASGKVNVTPMTRFRTASVAKTFVAATAVAMANLRLIDLQEGITASVPFLEASGDSVTMEHLLTHSAGFDERWVGYAAQSSDDMLPLGTYLDQRMPPRGWPLESVLAYSNHGMSLAALMLERRAGTSFAELAKAWVFDPLGMTNTFFLSKGGKLPELMAEPLSCTGAMECVAVDHVYSHAYPAGLAFSTAIDMGRYISGILEAKETGAPLSDLIPQRFTLHPDIPGISYAFFNQKHAGVTFLSHAGSVPGYKTLLMLAPEADFGFYLATNGGDDGFGRSVRDYLLNLRFGPEKEQPKPVSMLENVSEYAGSWEATRYSHTTIERFPQAFLNTIKLVAAHDTLIIVGAPSSRFVQSKQGYFQSLDGRSALAFKDQFGKRLLVRSQLIYGAELQTTYEARPFYRSAYFLNEYVSWILALPPLLFVLWPLTWGGYVLIRRRKGQVKRPTQPTSLLAVVGALVTSALFVVFGLGFVAKSNRLFQTGEMFYGIPEGLQALTWIPGAHMVFSGLSVIGLISAWHGQWWDPVRRILFLLLTLCFLLQVQFLYVWNYLPLQW